MANERILVVDDEKGVVHSCTRILQRQGFTVLGITDSAVVPDLLRQQTFDLLLTDIRMPKLDGLQLLQLAKEIDPHLTVVLITGYGTMEDAIRAIRLGAQGFLMKPFETEDLVAAVQDNLARRALLRDSLRLQTLLPLLEINQILQGSAGGETSLARRVLEIARRETGAARLAWLNWRGSKNSLTEMAVIPETARSASLWLPEAIDTVLAQAKPRWLLADHTLVDRLDGQASIIGAALPMIIQGEVVGILTAEVGSQGRVSPFDRISLDVLSVLAGQLAIILENVQLFEETKTLHAFNEDIIQNMTNGLIAVDRDGVITAFNPAAAAMVGQPPEQSLNQALAAALIQAGELTQILGQTLSTGQALAHQEITIGQTPVAVNTAPLVGGGVVGVLEDLSERRALEAERRRLDRLAALGEMSAVVAHEIRNPIASIAAGVEYLASKMAKNSPEIAGAAMIQGEIQRVNRILEDILFVARPFRLNLSSAENLAEIIEAVLQSCQSQIKDGQVTVSTNHAANLPSLRLDRQRMEQVLTNLIINAIQAMHGSNQPPENRRLFIQTEASPAAGQPKEVVITIADTGPGIPADARQRIFEPFFTTKARGTGLGLSVARRIVEEHRGYIKSESNEGQGTRFIITLPIT